MNNQTFSEIKFKGVFQLLKESWVFYRSRIKTFLGIIAIPTLFSFLKRISIFYLNLSEIRYSILFSFIWTTLAGTSLFLWFWAITSLIFAIKEKIRISEAYKKGLKVIIAYIWVYFLFYVIVGGGFLLFVIPGIIFFIWFSLAPFVLILEGKKGMNALFGSQHLISGKFWGVLKRFLGFGLILAFIFLLILLPLILSALYFEVEKTKLEWVSGLVGRIFGWLITPFVFIFGFLICENLREIKKEIPYRESSIKRKFKYVFPAIFGSLILILIVGLSFLNIFLGRDEPPLDDSDLWLPKIEIPKEENAYYSLSQAIEKIYLPQEKEKKEFFEEIVIGKRWNSEFAEEILNKNKETLDHFNEGIKYSWFQFPGFEDPKTFGFDTVLPSMRGYLDTAKINLIKAAHLFKQGNQKEAFDETFKVIKFGQLLEDSPHRPLIFYLMGMRIKQMGLEKLRAMLPETNLSPEILKSYVDNLEQFKLNKESLKSVLRLEYISLTNTKAKIDAAIVGKLSKEELKKLELEEVSFPEKLAVNYYYKPNKTQRMFIESFRVSINNVDKSYKEMELPEIKLLVPPSKIKMLFTENLIGKVLYDLVMVSYSGIFTRKCEEDFSIIGTQILLAIKTRQVETGKLITSLNELVSEYFSEMPKDPFDGKPIRFSVEKKIIYSVGKDLKDSDGVEPEDFVFKIEF